MTSRSLFCRLVREDLKRRVWVIALLLLAFFFAMPVKLSLSLENAAQSQYYRYNNYNYLNEDGSMTPQEMAAKVTGLKAQVVLEEMQFQNGLMAVLVILAAVVLAVTGFSYLHNKKKVDFYHSIPVSRGVLFGVQYLDGILMMAAVYLLNLVIVLGISMAQGISVSALAGTMAQAWFLHMLYYSLLYSTVVIAMMMTGGMVVGLLAAGVFFFFIPGMMLVIPGYRSAFFVTYAHMYGGEAFFDWGVKYLSPFCVYMTALSWDMKEFDSFIPVLINSVLGWLALAITGLQLYRIRPSEAAGRAMAFKKTMVPIRILLVLGFGMTGALFFWEMQNKARWGIFGGIVTAVLTHCIIQIIYYYDFKKLFSCKLQLALSAAAVVLGFCSFRYDWYGYDSYMPEAEKVESAAVYIGKDGSWIHGEPEIVRDGRNSYTRYGLSDAMILNGMELKELDAVLFLAEEGRREALEHRDEKLEGVDSSYTYTEEAAETVIGGADGPTSVFVVGKSEGDTSSALETLLTIQYRLADGRKTGRRYKVDLNQVMDAYESLYRQQAYKEGLYYILGETAETYSSVMYYEGGSLHEAEDPGALGAVLKAYQEDLRELTVEERRNGDPIGGISFVTAGLKEYVAQEYGGFTMETQKEHLAQDAQFWPVYPSFKRTIEALKEQGIQAGSLFASEQVFSIRISVENYLRKEWEKDDTYYSSYELPEGEELKALQAVNPRYDEEGYIRIRDPQEIAMVMDMVSDSRLHQMNGLSAEADLSVSCSIYFKDDSTCDGLFLRDKIDPRLQELFVGIIE